MSLTLTSVFSPIVAVAVPKIQSTSSVTSIAGYDQYETAAKIAEDGWSGTSDYAILAAGMSANLVDALAAGPLAAKLNAPIILTEGNVLSQKAKEQLTRLKVKQVFITSGSAVIKRSVIDEVKTIASVIEVKALGGFDASETSVNIAKEMANQGVKISKAVVAGGVGSDALSVATIAAAQGMPILYTRGSALSDYVASYLNSIKADLKQTYVIGGTAVISEAVKAQIPGVVNRYAGITRYDTNIEVLKNFVGAKNKTTYVASGQSMVDALAGVPLAVKTNSLILLTDQTLPEASKKYAQSYSSSNVIGLGGTAVVPTSVLTSLAPAEIISLDGSNRGSDNASNLEQFNGTIKVTGKNVTVKNAKTDYSIYIQGDNAIVDNVTVNGTIFLDPGDNGTATLKNVTATNIVVLSGADHSINLINVIAQLLDNQSSSSNVQINVTEGTRVVRTVSSSSASFYAAPGASFGSMEPVHFPQSPGGTPVVKFSGNIPLETIKVGEGVQVSNGGGGGGGGGVPQVVLNSIAITTPATKLTYTVGDKLDIEGLVVTGTYSDATTKVETITKANVTGFNSLVSAASQTLTITFGGKTTTYTVRIDALVAPAAPSSISATAISSTAINVHWNSSYGSTGYKIYRDENLVDTVTGTGFMDSGLAPGMPHTYYVVAYNNIGNSLQSGTASATTFVQGALLVSGVTNGATVNQNVTITAQSEGKTVTIAEAGNADVVAPGGVAVKTYSDGVHTLNISTNGGAQATLAFTIDKTAPTVTLSGVNDNAQILNTPAGVTLTPNYAGVDGVDFLADTKSVKLDGNPFDLTQAIKQPGQHTVIASVRDAAGNVGTATKTFTIVWDTSAPVITIGGVANGSALVNATPIVSLTGGSYAASYTYKTTITKPNGQRDEYLNNANIPQLTTEGSYTISVDAVNPSYVPVTSNKTIQFWIDPTSPTVSISGVVNNQKYNTSVTPVIIFTDSVASQALLKANSTVTLTKNGGNVSYSIGDTLSAEGEYILTAKTHDGVNPESATVSKSFTIDKTPPVITVTGITDGTTYRNDVTMTVGTTENAELKVLVNGDQQVLTNSQYVFSGVADAVTNFTVVITAKDSTENTTSKQISFSIDKLAVTNIITGVTQGQYLNNSPTISFSAFHGDVQLTEAGAPTATLDNINFTSGSAAPAGSHTLKVTTQYGGNTYSKTVTFTVDLTPPVVDNISVVKNAEAEAAAPLYVKTGDVVKVTAAVTDVSLQSQSFSIDSLSGSVSGEIPMTDVGGTLTGTWTVGGGNYSNLVLNVTGKDKAGNLTKTPWGQLVNIDNTPPAVTLITNPGVLDGDNGYFKAANMTVQLQAVAGEIIIYTFNNVTVTNNTGSVTLNAQQGYNKLTYRVQDQAGNLSDPIAFNFDYDSVIPLAPVVTSPASGTTGRSTTVTIAGTSEAGSTVVVRKADVDLAEGTVAQGGTFTVNGVTLSEGTNNLTLVTVDNAGNESLPLAYSLVLDSSAPILAVTKVDDTHYKVAVNETLKPGTFKATFNGTSIEALNITGPDLSGMYVITTPTPNVGANALFISASDTAGNLGTGYLTSSYIAPAVVQNNLQVSENAMMDIPADAFSGATQMTVRSGTFSGDSTYNLLGASLSFNFSEKPAQPVTIKILVGAGLTGVTLFHIAEDGTIGDPIIINTTTSALFNANNMTVDEGYYLSDTGYVWLKTKNFSDYQAALDDTAPVINFTVNSPVIRINKPGKIGGEMKLEGTVTDLDPLATITKIEIDGVSTDVTEAPLVSNVTGKSFNIPLSLSDGQHKVKLTAEDSAENSTTVRKTFIVDATPPEFKKATLEGYVAKDGDVYVTNTAAVVLNYKLSKNAEVFVNGQSIGMKNGDNSLSLNLPGEGNNPYEIKAIDPFGNEVSLTFLIRKDTIHPILTVQGVSDGGVYSSELSITVTSNENLTPVIKIDGTVQVVNANGTFIYAATNAGMHTLTASVTDLAGNTTTRTVTFTVDNSTPTLSFSDVTNGATYSSDQTLTISATNALQVFLTKIDNGVSEAKILASTGGTEVTSSADGTEHTYTFVAMAMRITNDGIKMANQSVTFTVDKKAPSLTFTPEAVNKMTGTVSLNGTLTETADVRVYVNESTTPIVTLTGQPAGAFVISNIALSMGDNTIKLVATDKVDLTSTVTETVHRTVSVSSITASNGQLALTFKGIGSAALTQADFLVTAKLNNSDHSLAGLVYANGGFTFTPIARAAQDQTLVISVSPATNSKYLSGAEVSSLPVSILANPAPAAPSVSADDVNNVIVGINDTMEYSLSLNGGTFTPYATYSSAHPPVLSGNVTVLVRKVATDSFPAGTPRTLVFTTNPVVLTSIAITTPATKRLYTVGDTLDLTGLVVTGTYSDNSTKVETITAANVTGFNSSVPAAQQTLMITTGGRSTTYKVDIIAALNSAAFDEFVDKLMEMYDTLSETDKDVLLSARHELEDLALTDSRWENIVTPMLTTQVVALYNGSVENAKVALSKFVRDSSFLQYSGNRDTLEANLNTFRTSNHDTFRTLLGNDFTMDELYNFLVATQEALPGIINSSSVSFLDLLDKTNSEIKNQIVEWTKLALLEVSAQSEYHAFANKLTAIGWNFDMIVEAQRRLGEVIDPSNAAEKALTLAAMRSQIVCTPTTMTVSPNSVQFAISVKGVDTPFNLAGLLDWYSSNTLVATLDGVNPTVTAVAQGTTIITAYKKGSTPGTSNAIVRMTLTVN